jgi:hypothetical protein
MEKADSWHHGVSPPSHQTRLDSLLAALKALANDVLTVGCVLANLHHRRTVSLMERLLRIFEMHEDADPVALVQFAGPLPAGIRGHTGVTRHRPQGRPK